MKTKDLFESPQLINDLTVIDIRLIQTECENILRANQAKVIHGFDKQTSLFKFEKSKNEGIYFLATDKNVDYACKYKKVEFFKTPSLIKSGARQILIHRFANASVYAVGIGATIFWDYLFPEYSCLVSDIQQTQDGKKFWEYRIKEAFEKNKTVRMINSENKEYQDINTLEDLASLNSQIWGKTKWFQRIIIVIF